MPARVLALSLLLTGCAAKPATTASPADGDSISLPPPANAAEAESGTKLQLFVDRDSTSTGADGSAAAPYRTITRALERAREARYGCPATGIAPSSAKIVIHVRSAASAYAGSFNPADFDPASSSFDPLREKLPLLVNVANLEMIGGGQLELDELGMPTGFAPGSAAAIRAEQQQGPKQYLMLIHRSIPLSGCGLPADLQMAGDGVIVRGFLFDGQAADLAKGLFPSAAIGVDRVADFEIVGNHITNSANAIWTSQASGQIRGNLAIANTTVGILVNGGSTLYPAKVTVTRNRISQNTELGLGLGGSGETESARRDLDLGANAFVSVPIPVFDRTVNPEAIPDALEAVVTGNELNDHKLAGVRLAAYYLFPYQTADETQEETANIHADFVANTCRNNGAHGIAADAGFTFRTNPRTWTGTMTLSFSGNQLDSNCRSPAFFDLGRYQQSIRIAEGQLPACDNPFEYLRDAVYEVTGDLTAFDYDSRKVDPTDGLETNSVLRLNGVEYGGATGIQPEVRISPDGCAPAPL